ncbi:MAG: hypothetical protein FWD47_14975 [Treponema sp.]|nr:hypothetical protein [Treponema sp.]
MNLVKWLTIIITGGLFLSCMTYYKGVEIQIIDDETKEPIKNIIVYHQVHMAKPIGFVDSEVLPVIQEKYITDENGLIFINNKSIPSGFMNIITSENIFINIDSTRANNILHIDMYFINNRPNPNFYGIIRPNEQYTSIKVAILNTSSSPGHIKTLYENEFIFMPINYSMAKRPKRIMGTSKN